MQKQITKGTLARSLLPLCLQQKYFIATETEKWPGRCCRNGSVANDIHIYIYNT